MAKQNKLNIKLTKFDIAVMLYNSTLQDVVQSEIKIMYFGLREGMAKPNTPEKDDAIKKGQLYKKKLLDDSLLLEMVSKAIQLYEQKSK